MRKGRVVKQRDRQEGLGDCSPQRSLNGMRAEVKGRRRDSCYAEIRSRALAVSTRRKDVPTGSLTVLGGCIDWAWQAREVDSRAS